MSERSLFSDPTMRGAFPFSGVPMGPSDEGYWEWAPLNDLLQLLHRTEYKEQALSALSKKRGEYKDLAIALWNSSKTIYLLISEITSIYRILTPEKLTNEESNRVCNAIALLQCLAAHRDTKIPFMKANVSYYLYPFLKTTETAKPFKYLRLTSLGAIGALVKEDDNPMLPVAVHFLLESEVVPLCLRCIDLDDHLAQSVATLIMLKILMQDEGLKYCCSTQDRFYAVMHSFGGMINRLSRDPKPSQRLLKTVLQCYLRISELPRITEVLKRCLPPQLSTPAFRHALGDDAENLQNLQQLFSNVGVVQN